MRVFINFTIALFTLFVVACTPDIKVPVPEVKVPLPPELIAAAAAAFAAGNSDEPCPPQEHEPATPADGVDNDHDGITEAVEKEVDWFDPFSIHGDVTVFCPDSCTIRMNLANGFKWKWLNPGTTERVAEFTFAGELLVPAFDHAQLEVSMGGPIDDTRESYVEVGEENVLRLTSLIPDNGGQFVLTLQKYSFTGMQVGHWLPFQILHVQEIN